MQEIIKEHYTVAQDAINYILVLNDRFLDTYKRLPSIDIVYGEKNDRIGSIKKLNRYIAVNYDEKKQNEIEELNLIRRTHIIIENNLMARKIIK